LPGEDHAWEMSHEEVYEHAANQGGNRVTEFHIVGGLHPDLSLDWYLEMLRGLKQRFPNAHLKAFTAIEIGWFAKREKLSIEEVLRRLRDAGLGSLPGGGAEIFHPEVREIICDGKLDADEWIVVHRVAHGMGIKSNCTMLYGHVERPEHKVDHLLRLRGLQDETGGFNAFIPLAYHPENNYMGLKYHTTGVDDLRHIAASRLVLDNIPHIKAYWVMVTPKLAQVALRFGADDMDGTIVEEKIYHMAGAGTSQQLSRPELERIVREAGFVPVERGTLYDPIAPVAPAPPETPGIHTAAAVAH
jgi:aminodeoxyfutalosine synthase